MMKCTYHVNEIICNIKISINITYRFNNMCNEITSINLRNVKTIIVIWDLLELMLFLHHDARSLPKKKGPKLTDDHSSLIPNKVR
jgi:hypothetical protein